MSEIAAPNGQAGAIGIPDWVDMDYGYDTANPRKPNMRELMEALSGRSVEDMYADPSSNWQDISRQASDLLYGVVGSNEDTRDWLSIMSSDDIVGAARKATGAMYEPVIDIASEYSDQGVLLDQVAVLKDKSGSVLRSLSEHIESASETLNNFGATSASVPSDLAGKADSKFFSGDFITFLENFQSLYEREQFTAVDETPSAEAFAENAEDASDDRTRDSDSDLETSNITAHSINVEQLNTREVLRDLFDDLLDEYFEDLEIDWENKDLVIDGEVIYSGATQATESNAAEVAGTPATADQGLQFNDDPIVRVEDYDTGYYG